MRGCSHPNIVQLHTSFSVKNELWLVLEYMDRGTNQQRFCSMTKIYEIFYWFRILWISTSKDEARSPRLHRVTGCVYYQRDPEGYPIFP